MTVGALKPTQATLEEHDLQELLRGKGLNAPLDEKRPAEAEASAGQTSQQSQQIDQVSISTRAAAANLMSENFATFGNAEESVYISAQRAGSQLAREMGSQLLDMVGGMLISPQQYVADRYGEAGTSAQAQMVMKRARDKEVYEQSEENLKAMRDKLEKAAAEAAAPKDENGDPLTIPGEVAPAEALPDTDIAPQPAEAPEVPEIREAAPEQAGVAALPSINIRI